MAWYKAGTVSVTNNSTAVTGVGTAFTDFVDAGQTFIGPDGLPYEIDSVVSATALTLARTYRGATASGQTYAIQPTQGYLRDLAVAANDLVLSFAAVRDGIGAGIMQGGTVGTPGLRFAGDEDTGIYRPTNNTIGLVTGGIERVRINSNGWVGIGTSDPRAMMEVSSAAPYFIFNETDAIAQNRIWRFGGRTGVFYLETLEDTASAASRVMSFSRSGNSATAVSFYLDDALSLYLASGVFRPDPDNALSLGSGTRRWTVVYAATGSINTSDERAKQNISAIPDDWLDAWGDVRWRRFIFKDAADLKGGAARWHIGLIAQQVRDAFAARGLDGLTIGLLCYDKWNEEREAVYEDQQTGTEDRPIISQVQVGERITLEAGDRWGLRYDECQAMEAAYQRREIARQQSTIEALSARLSALEGTGA